MNEIRIKLEITVLTPHTATEVRHNLSHLDPNNNPFNRAIIEHTEGVDAQLKSYTVSKQ